MGHAAKVILLAVLACVLWLVSLVAAMAVHAVACWHGNRSLTPSGSRRLRAGGPPGIV